MTDLGVPRATYRLQLTRSQGFEAATALVPYLERLGISHCYFSPYLKTRPDSQHGYDVVDQSKLNPELGETADFEALCRTLEEHGMGQILDIVPNHIGIMGSDNKRWLDVLENGQASLFADFFDIDWRPVTPELKDKVLVPILGDQYGNTLLGAELELKYDDSAGEFSVFYFQHRFPLDPSTYPALLQRVVGTLAAELPAERPEIIELESIMRSLTSLPHHSSTDPAQREVRSHEQLIAKRRLRELTATSSLVSAHIAQNVATYNGVKGQRDTFADLHRLLEAQPYRLAYWRVAADEINYRRFFDINDLAGLRTQNEAVLEATHRRVLEWAAEGKIHGFRIDHPDGLYDPRAYLRWLKRELAAVGCPNHYLVVEKILAAHEHLPEDWPVHGTTGYEFSFATTSLFVYSPAEREFVRTYRALTRQTQDFDTLLCQCKRQIILFHLSSELTVLANLLNRIAEMRLETRDFTLNALRATLLELIVYFPVYRSYVADRQISEQDRQHIERAVSGARHAYEDKDEGIFAFIRKLLLFEIPADADEDYRRQVDLFTAKFQQLTAPVMAKALEDTSFYRYVPLLSLNEVGSDPRRFGSTPTAFHRLSQLRVQYWPHSMLGSSTHDSKRSEDVRARLNVLSEMPALWRARVTKWRRFNQAKRKHLGDSVVPTLNDEYMFYQTLVGSWIAPADKAEIATYRDRIEAFMTKALREAKLSTSWANPNAAYESAVTEFVTATLMGPGRNRFLEDLDEFAAQIAVPGFLNALSQTLLKLTSPGVPDIYQGNELWDFSLVDPDNRRPVDYALRERLLAELEAESVVPERLQALLRGCRDNIGDGRAKLYLTWRTLKFREAHSALFDSGTYLPLEVRGSRAEHVCAFARQHNGTTAITVVGRWFTRLSDQPLDWPRTPLAWDDTEIVLPSGGRYRHVFTTELLEVPAATPTIPVEQLLAGFPAALLASEW